MGVPRRSGEVERLLLEMSAGRFHRTLGAAASEVLGELLNGYLQRVDDAVHAAVTLSTSITRWSHELQAQGYPVLRVGIGIHRGEGLAGLVGTQGRMEYAFVGSTVNIAARVQTLTRQHDCGILITEAVREKLNPGIRLRALPPEQVKGIAQPMSTYQVLSPDESQGSAPAN